MRPLLHKRGSGVLMNQKIGTFQTAMLILNTVLPTALVILPVIVSIRLEQDSMFGILFASFFGIGIALLIGTIVKQNQGAPFLEWIGQKTTPWIAGIVGIFFLEYYVEATSNILREYVLFLKDNVLNKTPVPVLTVTITMIALYMVSKGIESVARVNSLFVLVFLFFLLFYVFGIRGYSHLSYLLPMFEHDVYSFMLGSLSPISWMSEVSVLLFLGPFLKSAAKARLSAWLGITSVSFLMLFTMVFTLSVYGPQYIKTMTYPNFKAANLLYMGNFLSNFNVVIISFWMLIGYVKLALFLFVTLQCFKQIFRVSESETKPFLLAITIIIALECIFRWKDAKMIYTYGAEKRFFEFMLFNVLIPLGFYLWSLVKRKKKHPQEA